MHLSGAVGAVLELVAKHPSRPLLIALDGASAAGTCTLAAAVGPLLSASVVGADDFYRDMPEKQRWALTATQGVAEYFDWQRLICPADSFVLVVSGA